MEGALYNFVNGKMSYSSSLIKRLYQTTVQQLFQTRAA